MSLPGPHYVYIVRGAAEAVLYVGLTMNLKQRFGYHKAMRARWWPHATRIDLEAFDDRDEAATRELDLIDCLRPQFNQADGRWRERDKALLNLYLTGRHSWRSAGEAIGISYNAVKNVRRRLQATGQIARQR